MEVGKNITEFKKHIPEHVTLVAVSKTKPNELIVDAYDAGQRVFGENKVQDLVAKYESLPKDIQWHMIGHLQSNKVKYIAPFVSLIHGVDSLKLLKEIDKRAGQNKRVQAVLLQLHIAQESTKFGLSYTEAEEILDQQLNFTNIEIQGFMGMATNTQNHNQIKTEFSNLQAFFLKQQTKHSVLKTLSMGMSNDYELAIECGSNMIRIGSTLFGLRSY
jgi:pyridoxal phosphate enzyme (YggS family)